MVDKGISGNLLLRSFLNKDRGQEGQSNRTLVRGQNESGTSEVTLNSQWSLETNCQVTS